jgi:hypothetical protein
LEGLGVGFFKIKVEKVILENPLPGEPVPLWREVRGGFLFNFVILNKSIYQNGEQCT